MLRYAYQFIDREDIANLYLFLIDLEIPISVSTPLNDTIMIENETVSIQIDEIVMHNCNMNRFFIEILLILPIYDSFRMIGNF